MEGAFSEPGQRAQLLGRDSECAVLDGLVSAIRRGEGRPLVVHGEAGIGKTALLEYLIASASDLTVLRATGVESEMELAYASLHQLCASVLDRLPMLPAPQREALEIVFGLSPGAAPDRFLLGLAVLSLLSEAAEDHALLCVLDDAQWLDQASALTLAFVARRLQADPVGLVFSAREPGEGLRNLPQLEVKGLVDSAARDLLGKAVVFNLDSQVQERIVAETHGNPLALLELPQGLTASQLDGGFGLLDTRGLSRQIEESFVRRLLPLPEDTRLLLLVAAADPVGDALLLWRGAEQLDLSPAAAEAAEADGLLEISGRVIFPHPLVRSAVYRSATPAQRQAVHRALAQATDKHTDPDRRVWHLAAATVGSDEQVALELERSAGRAQARGGLAAAAAFLERAAALTQDPARSSDRASAAAQASLQAGAFDAALRLAATAEAGPLDDFQRARLGLLRAHVAFASGLGGDTPSLLLNAARRLEGFDFDLARETYLTAWAVASAMVQPVADASVLLEIGHAVQALPPPAGAPDALDLLLVGLTKLVTDGHAAAAPTLRRAANALAALPVDDVLRWGWLATAASAFIWDVEGFEAICARQVQLVRDAGAFSQLPLGLAQWGMALAWMGDFAGAESCIAEFDSVTAATATPIASYSLLRLRALQGREPETAAAIATTLELAAARGEAIAAVYAHWAGAILYNGLGRYLEAAAAAREATSDAIKPWNSMWVLAELVEAAVRAGDEELARSALNRLVKTTQPSATEFSLGIEARCRALLSEGAAANDLYREAIERLSRTRLRPELARAHLLYGEWLRRGSRRRDARAQLHAAHDLFIAIGMEAFAGRAREELLATGETQRKRAAETSDDLTAQERQIAEMARDGFSNPEIGARLFLSPRTVEWHLRKIFGKLGIRSRHELIDALAGSRSEFAQA